jgi:hypothetical protein
LSAIKNALNAANIPKAAEVGIRSGIHLIVSLLREVSQLSHTLRDETLDFLIELFAEVKPLSLWGTGKIDIILDKSLHTVADFLEEIVALETTSEDGKQKAIKVLFSLGILRGSLPNLLSVVNLLRKQNIQADLVNEIKMLKNEKPKTEFDFEKRLKTSNKVYFKTCLASDATAPEKSPNVSITNDNKFIYLHSENEGLMKIGTGFNYTMLGKVYVHKPDYRLKERSSLVFIHGHLYYRSPRIAPLSLIEINIDTLEEIQTNIIFDNQVPNCLFPEMTSPDIEFPHPPVDPEVKTKGKDSTGPAISNREKGNTETGPNGTSTTVNPQKRDIRLMRPSQRSPIFTEGR